MSRDLPKSVEAERAVLGCLLKGDGYNQVASFLTADCFAEPRHRQIFNAIRQLTVAQVAVDIVTVSEELNNMGQLDRVGGRSTIAALSDEVVGSTRIKEYAKIIHGHYLRRRIMEIASELYNTAADPLHEPDEVVGTFVPSLVATVSEQAEQGFVRIGDIIPDTMHHIDEIQAGRVNKGIQTGFRDLDKLIGGLPAGLIAIGGRPGWGKTSLLHCMADNMVSAGHSVAFVSAEMRRDELATRALCTRARVNSVNIRTGSLTANEWTSLVKASNELAGVKYWIDDTGAIEIGALVARVSQLHHEHGIDAVFVDYLQILTTAETFQQKRLAVEYQVIQLTQLARTLKIPVILASQLNRTLELRGGNRWQDKRPTKADFKETGRVEEDAALVMAIFRPELYIPKKKTDYKKYEHVAEVIVLKQRQGPEGYVNLFFNAEHTRFEDMSFREEELPL